MVAASFVVSIIAVIAVLVVGLNQAGRLSRQAERMRESWQAQNALEIARDIQSERQRDARRTLYWLKSQGVEYSNWTALQRNQADLVLQQLNTAAYMAEIGLLPKNMLEENWGNVFRNVFVASQPRIEHRREKWAQGLWQPFVRLATRLLDEAPAEPFYPPDEGDLGPPPDVPTSLRELNTNIKLLVSIITEKSMPNRTPSNQKAPEAN